LVKFFSASSAYLSVLCIKRRLNAEGAEILKPGVIRYPGGCFADQYDWRDGVGPRDRRPTRVNFWADTRYKTTKAYEDLQEGPQKYESNHFGTDEFVSFCKMVGAEPYLAANVRSRDVRVFLEWLEYCNAPATRPRTKERASKHERLEFGLSICPRVCHTAHVHFKAELATDGHG